MAIRSRLVMVQAQGKARAVLTGAAGLLRSSPPLTSPAARPAGTPATAPPPDQTGNRARFEIEDNGRGIAPQDHERIFELFRRSGMQDQRGEGIGLAHVRALAYRLGGTVTVASELGKGSTFTVDLPVAYQAEGDDQ